MNFKLEKILAIVGASLSLIITIIVIIVIQVFFRFAILNESTVTPDDYNEITLVLNIISIVVGLFSVFNIAVIILILKVNENNRKTIGVIMIILSVIDLVFGSFGMLSFGFVLASGIILLSKQEPEEETLTIEQLSDEY